MGAAASALKDCLTFKGRRIERPSLKGNLNPSIHGVGETSYMNPLGRRSISRPSAEQLERASIVHIRD